MPGFISELKGWESLAALKRVRLFCLAALLLVLLAACAVSLKRPEIGLAGIELVGFGRVEQRFLLKLNIRNPNAVDIQLNTLDFDLELSGTPFAKGVAEKAALIPQGGESVLEVMTVSRLAQLLTVLRELQKQGQERVPYRIVGYAEVEGFGRLPFERRGEIAVSALGRFMSR